MRPSYFLLFSAGLALASTAGYLYITRQEQPGTQADKSPAGEQPGLEDIAEEWQRQIDQFDPNAVRSNTTNQLAALLDMETDTLREIDKDLDKKSSGKEQADSKPTEETDAPDEPAAPQQPPGPEPANRTNTPEADGSAPPTLTDLETLRNQTEALTQRKVVHGKTYPYRLAVPAGWKILSNEPERCVLAWEENIFVFIETGPWNTTQEEWARKSLADVIAAYPGMQLAGQDQLEIDARPWLELILRESGAIHTNPREMLLLTYGARKHGSYRIVISGQAHALDRQVEAVNQLLSTWHFPPDNFQPENVSSVRVYVDGQRQYF